MIELEQIKTTDKLGSIRPLINTALSEIQQDQPFIGYAMNPSINFYDANGTLVAAVTASEIMHQRIYAHCYPESNGIFVARFYGDIMFDPRSELTAFNHFKIDVPSIKIPTRDTSVGTFVSPAHLGLNSQDSTIMGVGIALFNMQMAVPLRYMIDQHDTTCDIDTQNPNTYDLTFSSSHSNTITLI